MKIDAQIPGALPRAVASNPTGDAESARWLAQLEHAYLASLAHEPSPARSRDAGAGAPDGRRPAGDDALPPGADARAGGEATPRPDPGFAAAPVSRTPSAAQAMAPAASARPAPPVAIAAQDADPAPVAAAASTRARPRSAHDAPEFIAERMPAPRYARQRMQVATSDTLSQVTLRDATLADADAQGVARAIAAQLRTDGRAAVRVFVNGRRFDFAGPADPGDPAPHAPSRPDQEA